MRKARLLLMVFFFLVAGPKCFAQEPKAAKVIAIMPFENSTGKSEYEPFGEGMVDILTAYMEKIKGVSVVSREHMDKILAEYKIALSQKTGNAEVIIKVGKLLGAKMILTGGFILVADTLKINGHLYDVETTQVIKSEEVEGKASQVSALAYKLVNKMAENLDLKLSQMSAQEIDESPEVNLHFMRGLGYYYSGMYDHAIMEFTNTLSLDSTHADARFWNARSYYNQKEWSHARIELERFLKEFPKSGKIGEAQKMLKVCEGNLEDWEKELFTSFKLGMENMAKEDNVIRE